MIRELERRPGRFESRLCVTGSAPRAAGALLDLFGLSPDTDPDVMSLRQAPSDVAAAIMQGGPSALAGSSRLRLLRNAAPAPGDLRRIECQRHLSP
jgi:UDP-N-acetylglucosamine 2-epimerase